MTNYDQIHFSRETFLGRAQIKSIDTRRDPAWSITRDGSVYLLAHTSGETWEIPAPNVVSARRAPVPATPTGAKKA
jgi:hypothetical protein